MSDAFQPSWDSKPVNWPQRAANQTRISPDQSDQWLRKIELTIYGSAAGDSLNFTPQDGPDLKVVFRVQKMTNQSPNLLEVRIYNLNPQTEAKAIAYTRVMLAAGYQTGRFGKIFQGTITQFRRGKENSTDTYLEILAGDGDLALGFSAANLSFEKGTSNNDQIRDGINQFVSEKQSVEVGHVDAGQYGEQQSLRFSGALTQLNQFMRMHSRAANADWFVDDGKVNFLRRDGYMPGAAQELTPATGLVGIPEVTPGGIQMRCLLNPNLILGGLVKVKTELLSGVPYLPGGTAGTQPLTPDDYQKAGQLSVASWGQQLAFPAFTSPTGTYKILLLEHNGDTRGNPWYSEMVCVALNESGNAIFSPSLPFQRSIVSALPSGVTTLSTETTDTPVGP